LDLRKNIYSLSATELRDFIDAVNVLKANGTYDMFIHRHHHAMMHATPMPGEPSDPLTRNVAHRGPAFLAWHRQEIREYELALQAVKPGVTLPYWDWAEDAQLSDPRTAPLWTDAYMGGDGAGPNDFVPNGPFTHWVALEESSTGDLNPRSTPGIKRLLGRDPGGFATLPTQVDVTNCLSEDVYDSAPWDRTSNPSFRNRLEGWLIRSGEPNESRMHNRVHTWVGGDMLPGTSPNDPVFFLHHCNVDRLWAKWQADKGAPYAPLSGGPVGHNAMDTMMYLENSNATPGSVLDHHAMGYMYDTEGSSIMDWNLAGNANTNPNTDFLGTTDTQPVVVKTNGAERMRIIPDGKVGIGTNAPDKRLSVQEATASLRFSHEGGPAVLRVENSGAGSLAALNLGNNARNWQLRVEGTDGNKFKVFDATAIADRLAIDTAGNVGIGTPNPQRMLDIAAAHGSTELVIRDNSQPPDQRVWRFMNNTQRFAIEAVNDALTGGTSVMNFTRPGNVGIGTYQPSARLSVIAPGASELGGTTRSSTLLTSAGSLAAASGSELALASIGFHSGNNTSLGIRALRTANGVDWGTTAIGLGMDVDNTVRAGGASLWLHGSGKVGVGGIGASRARLEILDTAPETTAIGAQAAVFAHSLQRHGVYSLTSSKSSSYYAVFGDNDGGGTGVLGFSRAGTGVGVQGISPSGYGVAGNSERYIGVTGSSASGLAGILGNFGSGVPFSNWGNANNMGVVGTSSGGDGVAGITTADQSAGVYGVVTGVSSSFGMNYGVQGTATHARGVGVFGQNTVGGDAGYFEGRVGVRGAFTASNKSFKIDHPVDPANKYLYHASVESPDMLCLYSGNITTNARGNATIVLPPYFGALNRDFKYQLTVIGQAAQAMVEREIENNRFSIKTDKPNVKVSWQVTGIRQDPYAEANRIPVEQYKADQDRGRYLHPEVYELPEEESIRVDRRLMENGEATDSGERLELPDFP